MTTPTPLGRPLVSAVLTCSIMAEAYCINLAQLCTEGLKLLSVYVVRDKISTPNLNYYPEKNIKHLRTPNEVNLHVSVVLGNSCPSEVSFWTMAA